MQRVDILREIEKRLIWLSTYTVHHANNLRPKRDGLKVGGHQASSTSVATILTALYFHSLKGNDRIAIKPHAQPIFQAAQYLHGCQTLEKLKLFRSKGGIQSYPSRTKDGPFVDFSTGSVGLGASVTTFACWAQEYLTAKGMMKKKDTGKMYALVGGFVFDD
jgi:pyruvate dehydrogenase E1 component